MSFLGLGWPWVGEFAGFIIIFMFSNPTEFGTYIANTRDKEIRSEMSRIEGTRTEMSRSEGARSGGGCVKNWEGPDVWEPELEGSGVEGPGVKGSEVEAPM